MCLEVILFFVFCIILVGIINRKEYTKNTSETEKLNDVLSDELLEIEASLPKSKKIKNEEPQKSIVKNAFKVFKDMNNAFEKFNDDLEAALDEIEDSLSKNKKESKINDLDNVNKYIELNSEQEKIKIFLEKRNITTLIHFTDKKNLNNILINGLLSVEALNNSGFNYCYNDNKRLDGQLNYISLSVTKPNIFLLKSFIKQQKIKNPFLIEIDASMLWKENNKRVYCQTNAATSGCKKRSSIQDFEAMFEESVRYHTSYSDRHFNRFQHKINETTDIQAEILWSSKVSPQYFVRYYPYTI